LKISIGIHLLVLMKLWVYMVDL